MRKFLLLLLAGALLVSIASVSFASDAQTVNGWISESKCGVKGANAVRKNAPRNVLQPAPAPWSLQIKTRRS